MDLIDKYLGEQAKKKFIGSYETHNKKISVKMERIGSGMKGPFLLTVTQDGKDKEMEFSSEKGMKDYWKKIHKANLK